MSKNKIIGIGKNKHFTNIYGLVDPREPDIVRYIGKADIVLKRLKNHIREVNKPIDDASNIHKCNWIKSLLQVGVQPKAISIAIVKKTEWEKFEIHYIKLFKSFGARLLNISTGGDCGPVMRGKENPNYGGKTVTEYQKEVARKSIKEGCHKSEGFLNYVDSLKGAEPWNKGLELEEEKYKTGGKKNKGKKHSEGTKQLMSEQRTGESHPMFGKHHSEETKEKIAEGNRNKIVSSETRQILSDLFSGEGNPFYGKQHTEEAKSIIREKKKGSVAWNKGLPLSEESKKLISDKNKGRFVGEKNPMFRIPSPAKGSRFQWINNGITNKRHPLNTDIPKGWVSGMLCKIYQGEEHPSFGIKFQWINDGIVNKKWPLNEEIPEGFLKGKTRYKY